MDRSGVLSRWFSVESGPGYHRFFKEQGAFPNNSTGWEVSCHGPWLPLIASEHLRFARNWQIDWQIFEVFQARVAFMAWSSFCSF
jgi:hypothetical protein